MEFSFEHFKKLRERVPPLEVPFVERIDTENKVLECRVCDRTMLVALTDLIDPDEVERMEEEVGVDLESEWEEVEDFK
jgi:hypothetical protein